MGKENKIKQLLLTAIGVAAIVVFFLLPKNRAWFNDRIVGYWNDFNFQRHDLDPEVRKIERWGNSYVISKQVAEYISKRGHAGDALILLPPTAYFKERKVNYHVPEPAVFYYYTGLKTTWINSKLASNSNWMIIADRGELKIVPVTSKKMIYDSLKSFNRYPLSM